MEVFRITLEKWSNSLTGSGYEARWNSRGKFVIYTSSSRALASLENIVHRSGEGLNQNFKTMVIHIPDKLGMQKVMRSELKDKWYEFQNFRDSQAIADRWLDEGQSAVFKVPSAIIKYEHNYLLNPRHPEFAEIKIIEVEDFDFDPRIKE